MKNNRRINIEGDGPWRVAVTEMVKKIDSLADDVTSERNLNSLMRDFKRREAQRKWLARHYPNGKLKPLHQPNRHIRERAHIVERINDRAELWIGYNPLREEALSIRADASLAGRLKHTMALMDPEALNGYVAFSKRRAPRVYPRNDDGLVGFIPVHGGITWAKKDGFACVYGFDTMHFNSQNVPRTDPDWVRHQCHILYVGLRYAEEIDSLYRRAKPDVREKLEAEMANANPDRFEFE